MRMRSFIHLLIFKYVNIYQALPLGAKNSVVHKTRKNLHPHKAYILVQEIEKQVS